LEYTAKTAPDRAIRLSYTTQDTSARAKCDPIAIDLSQRIRRTVRLGSLINSMQRGTCARVCAD